MTQRSFAMDRTATVRPHVAGLFACGLLAMWWAVAPVVSQEPEQKTKSKPQETRTHEVIAEGVGTTADEAKKDAYRNAVRQVVGLYVDAESLVKNDELLNDEILTYSDGFITKAEVVPKSEKKQGGTVRLRIKATVERKSLVAKLKSANFTVKSLDGESLFAKAVTEHDSVQDATAVLQKALSDLPTILTAEVVGKPDYDREKSEILVDVAIQADRKAYAAFSKRLEETLNKISVSKEVTSITAVANDGKKGLPKGGFHLESNRDIGGPKLKNSKQWAIWLNTFNNASHTLTKWNVYIVEADMKPIVQMLEMPTARKQRAPPHQIYRPSNAKTKLVLSALDADENLITEFEEELITDKDLIRDPVFGLPTNGLSLMRHFLTRNYDGSGWGSNQLSYVTVSELFKDAERLPRAKQSLNLYLSPYALAVKERGGSFCLGYYPTIQRTYRFKATLDELQQIRELKSEVKYEPARD